MAFSTQRKFPGQCYENHGFANIKKMKVYNSIKDHRAWSIDQNQQTSYLVDAVHKDEGDTINLQHTLSNGVVHCRNENKKVSKRVGTVDANAHASVGANRSDSLQILKLSMELEETKLNNRTLKDENSDLRKRMANVVATGHAHGREENVENHLKFIEEIISERDDLRELLDKFLDVTDQIIELKIQADQMKNMESEYVSLQTAFQDHQIELEALRNEKKAFEDRILELQTTNQETTSLKETNSKLEKDLYELSNMIAVSDNFIHDQENEIKTKLHTITELNKQIENLKVALSEAEMKLNKKLRLEMDVELMEKELSIMIENSADSNVNNQHVIDRQVEDLATAIKLTLGCMNDEFENSEEENLVEANRQLKTLLLESSNKILEFKDVINKQEQNIMKVANDFACKNDELTECLATVEELKRKLANREATKNTGLSNATKIAMPCTDDVLIDSIDKEQELFVKEMNLADSPPNSDYEDDGPEIDDLEIIFEKSVSQHDHRVAGLGGEEQRITKVKSDLAKPQFSNATETSNANYKMNAEPCSADVLRLSDKIEQMHSYITELESRNQTLTNQLKENPVTGIQKGRHDDPYNERDICETPDLLPESNANHEFENLQHKLHDMTSEMDNLQKANEELRETIRMLQLPVSSKQSSSKSQSQLLNEAHREKLTHRGRLSTKSEQFDTPVMSSDVKKIENENVNLKLENDKLVAEIQKLKNSENCSHMDVLRMEEELAKLTSINQQLSAELDEKKLAKDLPTEVDALPPNLKSLVLENEEFRNDNEKLLLKIRCLEAVSADKNSLEETNEMKKPTASSDYEHKPEQDWLPSNEDLVAEIDKLQDSKNKSNMTIRQMEKDLKKLESINENLLVQLNDKEAELKQFSIPPDVEQIHRQNEELRILNGNLSSEVSELKNSVNSARSNEADMKEKLEKLAAINKNLIAEMNALKQTSPNNDPKTHQLPNDILSSEMAEPISPANSSHVSILQIGKDLERLAALNESLLAFNDNDKHSLIEGMAPDISQLLKRNQELKNANETLSEKIKELQNTENRAQSQAIELKNRLETLADANQRLQARSNEQLVVPNMQTLKNENEKLKSTNDNLLDQVAALEEKLQSIENRTAAYFKTSSSVKEMERLQARSNEQTTIPDIQVLKNENESLKSTNDNLLGVIVVLEQKLQSNENCSADYSKTSSSASEQLSSTEGSLKKDLSNDYSMEIDWMVADMKKLQSKNESLRATNEKLLSQISEIKNESEKLLNKKESDCQLIYANNRNIEIEWMKSDMDALKKKNEKLKNTNDSLVAEITALKGAETRGHKNVQQMEKDLLRLSAINDRLSSQLNEKRMDKKQLPKARGQDVDAAASESKDLLNKIQELTKSNDSLQSEISELKSLDIVKMRNDLRKLSSANESLKMQISELKLLSANDIKMESDWMAADKKKLLNKNKKLNMSNQNLLNEINELRREFKSLENRANANALQKLKELERLTALNDTLKDQINIQKNDKKNSKIHAIDSDGLSPDVKKVQKKNDELKAANEKLLSVIINLKNSEKLASSKASDLEDELKKLQDVNKNLQDTIENYVEKDWSKPKTELERICQLILNEGIRSLTDTEFHYMYKWFCRSASAEFEIPKTSRKNTTRKHCRICHQSVDTFDKSCDCKQYEEKKRLSLLKEIEETKLAIEHIQSSNDIEFDLNDVKNRLLKGKPTDQAAAIDRQYEIRMSKSQGNVNVRAQIITKPGKCGNQLHK